MSKIISFFEVAVIASLVASPAMAFDSGSNGSFGPLNLASGDRQIVIPPDGILHCTTINIPSQRTLSFIKNADNTPVYLLATGDVTISGTIDLSGQSPIGKRGGASGPGGFDGGQGGPNPGDGFGPGGGKGGYVTSGPPTGQFIRGGGGFGTASTRATTGGAVYGNSLLIPLTGGSGGGGGNHPDASSQHGGGGGGGAILIASNTKIVFSWSGYYISAYGGSAVTGHGGGSGGAVRLVAPEVSGNAGIGVGGQQEGGFGRIRVDALINSLNIVGSDSPFATFGSNLVVFPPNSPEIRITQAAGRTVPLTQTDPVFVLLPPGTPATQTIQVQVKNFNEIVPLTAVVTPEAGARSTYNFQIDNTTGAATSGTVDVQIPAGVSTRLDVWTR